MSQSNFSPLVRKKNDKKSTNLANLAVDVDHEETYREEAVPKRKVNEIFTAKEREELFPDETHLPGYSPFSRKIEEDTVSTGVNPSKKPSANKKNPLWFFGFFGALLVFLVGFIYGRVDKNSELSAEKQAFEEAYLVEWEKFVSSSEMIKSSADTLDSLDNVAQFVLFFGTEIQTIQDARNNITALTPPNAEYEGYVTTFVNFLDKYEAYSLSLSEILSRDDISGQSLYEVQNHIYSGKELLQLTTVLRSSTPFIKSDIQNGVFETLPQNLSRLVSQVIENSADEESDKENEDEAKTNKDGEEGIQGLEDKSEEISRGVLDGFFSAVVSGSQESLDSAVANYLIVTKKNVYLPINTDEVSYIGYVVNSFTAGEGDIFNAQLTLSVQKKNPDYVEAIIPDGVDTSSVEIAEIGDGTEPEFISESIASDVTIERYGDDWLITYISAFE